MAVTITATPEPELARVAIKAEGGTIGQAFFIGRRGRDGTLALARETSESSKVWLKDPAGARVNLFTRPRFELTAAAQTVFQNEFQNPAFLTSATVANAHRTNLANNPSFEGFGWYESAFGSGSGTAELLSETPFAGSQYIRTFWATPSLWGGVHANNFAATAGKEYAVSIYVRTNALKHMRLVMRWEGSNVQDLGPEQTIRAFSEENSSWTRLTWTGTAPSGATKGLPAIYLTEGVGQRWSAGDWLDIDAMLIEQSAVIGTYFDGSQGGTEDEFQGRFDAAWTGEAHRTTSVLYPVQLWNITGQQADIRYYSGGALILPNGVTNDSSALIHHRNRMAAGKTYTIGATIEVLHRSGTAHENAGKLTVTSCAADGTVLLEESTPAVEPGESVDVVQTFDIPAGTQRVDVRVWNGSTKTKGRTVFRNMRIFEGTVDPGVFTGDNPAEDEFIYAWNTPVGAAESTGSAVMQAIPPAGGFIGVGAQPIASEKWKANGTYSMRIFPTGDGSTSYVAAPSGIVSLAAGKTYTFLGTQWLPRALTGDLGPDARRVRVTGVGMDKLISSQPDNVSNQREQLRWTFTVPAGATSVRMEFVHGGAYGSGDVYWDEVLVVEGEYIGDYFDGEFATAAMGGWTGTKDASTSRRLNESLPITIYDYEARQGQTMEYFVLDANGAPVDEGTQVFIPEWGTWLKDPFRPHLNTRLWFNSDSSYTRQANRVLLTPRGARLPIAQWERRSAPEGKIRLLTETAEDARALTTIVDEAGVVFLDVAEDFGVPFRYVSLGDVTGVRAVSDALRDQHRYWDIDMQEVAIPVGEPSTLAATYENLMITFASYLELRTSVPDYRAVAAGEWG